MKLEILKYPDPRLRRKAQKVTSFNSSLHKLIDDMHDTMDDAGGIGLASLQVGDLRDVLLIKIPKNYKELTQDEMENVENESNPSEENKSDESDEEKLYLEVINAKILYQSGEITWREGCLSIPGFYEQVKRYREIKVEFQDRFGKIIQMDATDLLAVVFQHEMDHQRGVLFIDRISIMKRKKFDKAYKVDKK